MHLIDKDPMKSALNKAIKNKTSNPVSKFTPAINAVTGTKYEPSKLQIKKKPNYKIPATPKVSGENWGG